MRTTTCLVPFFLLACGHAFSPQQLMDLDRQFARDTEQRRVEGWVSYFAADGAMLPDGGERAVGQEAIRRLMAPALSDPDFHLDWEPLWADASGDLGYTVGRSTVRRGGEVKRTGKYLTVWKRQSDGSWKIVLDIGNQGTP